MEAKSLAKEKDLQDEEKQFDQDASQEVILQKLGYKQELKRSFNTIGMIGFSFSIITSWTALGGTLMIGVQSGGPAVMIYAWLVICLLSLAVAYSMAEMCSAYPVAGGQYSWVFVMAPPEIARGLAWITGWFMLIGILAMGAVNNYVGASFILGQVQLSHPDYTIERWHMVLVTYVIAWMAAALNLYGNHLLSKISNMTFAWNLLSFVVVVITILICSRNQLQTPKFVFASFENTTGFPAPYAAILGILQAAFGLCCYDTPAHMTEELHSSSTQAPKTIILSVWIGAVTGFIFLIAASFCIPDIATVANTPTGVPLIEIFHLSTNSVTGSCVLASCITIVVLFTSNSLLAEGSRAVFAFARDHGLPFSSVLRRVSTKHHVPYSGVLLAVVVQMILNSIYFGSVTGFDTIIAIATEGFYLSYAMPLLARLLSHYRSSTRPELKSRLQFNGPYKLPRRLSLTLNALGLVFVVFCVITFNFPTTKPVTSGNMNYTCVAIVVVMIVSAITWVVDGRKSFTGPNVAGNIEGQGESEVEVEGEGEEEGKGKSGEKDMY